MITSFHTISGSSAGEYKEKGSKFIALAFPVVSEDDAKARLTEVKKKYFDARHYCYAYILGADKSKFRAYDDGEPNHSAGDPILGQIRSKNLTNVLVIVVRYFGGTKLGVGGLVTAYKTAAEEALNRTEVIEKQIEVRVSLRYDYKFTPEVMRLIKDFDLRIELQEFTEESHLNVSILLKQRADFLSKIALLNALGIAVNINLTDS